MKWIVKNNAFIILLCLVLCRALLFLYISYRPYSLVPPGYTYNALGKNFYYPSMILQAKEGQWRIRDTHTTRETPFVFAQLFFVAWGKFAAVFHLDAITTYMLARLTGGIVAMFSIFFVITKLLPKKIWTFALLATTAVEVGPLLSAISYQLSAIRPAWQTQTLLERFFGLPHHSWGEALGILLFYFFLVATTKPTVKNILFFSLLLIAAQLTLPPFVITMIFPVAIILGIWVVAQNQGKNMLPTFLITIATVGALTIFFQHEFAKGSPWNSWTAAEKSWMDQIQVTLQYCFSLILYVPFILPLIFGLVFNRKELTKPTTLLFLTCFAWILMPFLLIPLTKFEWFPLANFRIVDGYHYFPAGILASIGVYLTLKRIPHMIVKRCLAVTMVILLIIPSFLLTTTYTKQYLTAQKDSLWRDDIYPKIETWEAIMWIKNLPSGSGVLVREYFGEILPAFGNIRVFIGGIHGFPDFLERRWLTERVYSGIVSIDDMKEFFEKNDISYIFYGPHEKAQTTTSEFYPQLLTPIFENSTTTIYKVN